MVTFNVIKTIYNNWTATEKDFEHFTFALTRNTLDEILAAIKTEIDKAGLTCDKIVFEIKN
jgi:hypothetical protein